jgi:hypothetical protein
MTDWIKHSGGPQPVADDVWMHRLEADIANLIDAARLEGIRLGLEAAGKVVDAEIEDWASESEKLAAIRALDPETIAREAADKETAR